MTTWTRRTAGNPKLQRIPEEERPGAIAVEGIDHHQPSLSSSREMDDEETASSPIGQGGGTLNNNNNNQIQQGGDGGGDEAAPPPPTLVEATIVRDAEVSVAVFPVATVVTPWWNSKWKARLLMALAVLLLGGVTVALVLTLRDDDSGDNNVGSIVLPDDTNSSTTNTIIPPEPSSPPSSSSSFPTPNPTERPKDWIYLTDLYGDYSDDGVGVSVAMSRRGKSIAVGAPGYDLNGAIVFGYRNGGWVRLSEIHFQSQFELGRSVALDDSGSVLAVGAYFGSYFSPNDEPIVQNETIPTGKVRVYRINATKEYQDQILSKDPGEAWKNYEQIGSDILGPELDEEFGWSVDMSNDGTIVAIGSRTKCFVRVVRFNESAQDWVNLGEDIECSSNSSSTKFFGSSVSLSGNGLMLAIGDPGGHDDFQYEEFIGNGDVSVYQYEQSDGGWRRLGGLIQGQAPQDGFGTSVSMSDDGMVVAIGAPFNDNDKQPIYQGDGTLDPSIGSCRVFRFNKDAGQWEQRGSSIFGESLFDYFGTAVSLNSDGNYLAVGATGSNDNGDDSGHVRVFEYVADLDTWSQVGGDIVGRFAFALSGTSVALSSKGDIVTIGSPYEPKEYLGFETVGFAQVFETGISVREGNFPVIVRPNYADLPGVRWSIDRLDVERQDLVTFANTRFHEIDMNRTETTVLIVEGGVYRFSLYCRAYFELLEPCYDLSYSIAIPADQESSEEIELVRRVWNNFTVRAQNTFLAKKPSIVTNTEPPRHVFSVHLIIDFDDRPENVHWVLLTSELNATASPMIRRDKTVVDFGPEESYAGPDYAWQTYQRVIQVPVVQTPFSGELQFVFTDDGRRVLQEGDAVTSYKLYNGTADANNGGNLLISGRADGNRRKVHTVSLV